MEFYFENFKFKEVFWSNYLEWIVTNDESKNSDLQLSSQTSCSLRHIRSRYSARIDQPYKEEFLNKYIEAIVKNQRANLDILRSSQTSWSLRSYYSDKIDELYYLSCNCILLLSE